MLTNYNQDGDDETQIAKPYNAATGPLNGRLDVVKLKLNFNHFNHSSSPQTNENLSQTRVNQAY